MTFLIKVWALFLTLAGLSYAAEFTDCDNCPTMITIPSGTGMVGSLEGETDRRKGERNQTTVNIYKPFAMAKTEVTLGQYRAFVASTSHQETILERDGKKISGCNYFDGAGYGYITKHSWQDPGYPQREDAPVVCVSWSDAQSYANWLSEKTGRNYRIPSTTEFEYALRAGSNAPWFWGENPDRACEFANIGDSTLGNIYPKRAQFSCDDGYLFTAPVAKFKPNNFGLYDMIGNAWEWTNDCWHDDLSSAPRDGSSWLENNNGECTARTPKGGSWISGAAWARAAVRSKDHQHYRSFLLGFRVAAELKNELK